MYQFSDDAILIVHGIAFGFAGVTLALESGFGLATDFFVTAPLVVLVVLFWAYAQNKWARYKADGDEPSESPDQPTATDGGRR